MWPGRFSQSRNAFGRFRVAAWPGSHHCPADGIPGGWPSASAMRKAPRQILSLSAGRRFAPSGRFRRFDWLPFSLFWGTGSPTLICEPLCVSWTSIPIKKPKKCTFFIPKSAYQLEEQNQYSLGRYFKRYVVAWNLNKSETWTSKIGKTFSWKGTSAAESDCKGVLVFINCIETMIILVKFRTTRF